MPDKGGVAQALAQRLETMRGVEVLWIKDAPDADALSNRLKDWLAAGPVQGVYWLSALDNEGDLAGMDLASWHEALWVRAITALYHYARSVRPGCKAGHIPGRRPPGWADNHGYDAAGATCPLGGAVTGFAKAYRRERPNALVKSVDFALGRKTAALADSVNRRDPSRSRLCGSWLRRRPPLGRRPGGPPVPRPDEASAISAPNRVFVVTGAAGSIVSAITADLAAAWRGTFHLLDLTPGPDPADPDLRRYTEDRDGFKNELPPGCASAASAPRRC